jgi:hypothetical protein
MKLEDQIRQSIYEYPSLYRAKTYEQSRLHVLDHIMVGYGTGYEWSRDGFLFEIINGDSPVYGEQTFDELPDGFFDKELYDLEVAEEDLEEAEKALEGRFYYVLDRDHRNCKRFVFEATEEEAKPFFAKFDHHNRDMRERMEKHGLDLVFCHKAECYGYEEGHFSPHDCCEYSPVQEMVKGKTNSHHIENFDLTDIQPDWIQGGVDIAKATIEFYKDKKWRKSHFRHPSQYNGFKDKKSWKKFRKKQIAFFEAFLEKFDGERK